MGRRERWPYRANDVRSDEGVVVDESGQAALVPRCLPGACFSVEYGFGVCDAHSCELRRLVQRFATPVSDDAGRTDSAASEPTAGAGTTGRVSDGSLCGPCAIAGGCPFGTPC